PLVVDSLRQEETGRNRSMQDIGRQILVLEDRPGLTIGSNAQRTKYPVLVIVKNSPFTSSELDLVKKRVSKNDANVFVMPGGYVQPPYELLSSTGRDNNVHPQQQQHSLSQARYDQQKTSTTFFGLKPPTDDSPFYFAEEQIPKQLILLIEMVLGVSAVLALLLVYYSKANKIRLTASSRFHL